MQRLAFSFLLISLIHSCVASVFLSAQQHRTSKTLQPRANLEGCAPDDQERVHDALKSLEALAYFSEDATKRGANNLTENAELYRHFRRFIQLPPDASDVVSRQALQIQRDWANYIAKRVYLRLVESQYLDAIYQTPFYIHCNDVERKCVEGEHAPAYLMRWHGPDDNEVHVALVSPIDRTRPRQTNEAQVS